MTYKLLKKSQIILWLLILNNVFAQQATKTAQIDALNEYVRFANESVHGLLIAHRLFENYNQDINKFVDLPGHQLNFYSNADLPQNIFEDPENWFYEVSPVEIYAGTLNNFNQIKATDFTNLQQLAARLNESISKANNLRLSIGESITRLDLKNTDNVYKIYGMLEEAVDQYDLALAQIINMDHQLSRIYNEIAGLRERSDQTTQGRLFEELYRHAQQLLLGVKAEDKNAITENLLKLNQAAKKLQASPVLTETGKKSSVAKALINRLFETVGEIDEMAQDYKANQPIPDVYDQYGHSYYYYNTKLISRFNRYGNGIVTLINQINAIRSNEELLYLELPHHLKVIYPVKLEQQLPVISSTIREVAKLPEELENRKVVLVDKAHEIIVDAYDTEIEIFDYLHQDGDIISLNFNGDWIIQELSLESKPKRFILKLNTSGENYLILHAVNEGSIPPNTIGINYTHKGRKKRYIMQSNLKTSQMVKIRVDEGKK